MNNGCNYHRNKAVGAKWWERVEVPRYVLTVVSIWSKSAQFQSMSTASCKVPIIKYAINHVRMRRSTLVIKQAALVLFISCVYLATGLGLIQPCRRVRTEHGKWRRIEGNCLKYWLLGVLTKIDMLFHSRSPRRASSSRILLGLLLGLSIWHQYLQFAG